MLLFYPICEVKSVIRSKIFDFNQICRVIQGKFVKSKLKNRYLKRYLKLCFLSLAKFSIWSCSFVIYEAYFSFDLKSNPLSEIFYLSKICGIYSVLRTWASSHFLTYTFGKNERELVCKSYCSIWRSKCFKHYISANHSFQFVICYLNNITIRLHTKTKS